MLIITLTCDNITCQQISTSFDNLSVTLTFTVGRQPILELVPKHLHERSPIFLGSEDDVMEVIQTFTRHQQLG